MKYFYFLTENRKNNTKNYSMNSATASDNELVMQMGSNGYDLVQTNFTLNKYTQKIMGDYHIFHN